MDLERVKQIAIKEINDEEFKLEVAKYKDKIRSKRSFLDRIFPYKILIIKRG